MTNDASRTTRLPEPGGGQAGDVSDRLLIHLITIVIYPLSTSPNLARRDLMAPLVLLNVCARPATEEPFAKSSRNCSSCALSHGK